MQHGLVMFDLASCCVMYFPTYVSTVILSMKIQVQWYFSLIITYLMLYRVHIVVKII